MASNTEPGLKLQDGDLLLILSKDGTVRTAGHNVDTDRLRLPPEQMNQEDLAIINNGEIMFALTFAVQNADVMRILIEASNDPELLNQDLMKQFLRPM